MVGQPQRGGYDPAWLHVFYILQLSDWFSLMQNRACTRHQLGKGMQTAALLRLISEEGCLGAEGGPVFLPEGLTPALRFLFVCRLSAVVFLVAAFWSRHLGVLFLPRLPTISTYSPSPSTMTKDKAFTV